MSQNQHDVLIEAKNVSKKFCRSLKRSLFYGAGDIARAFSPMGKAAESAEELSLRKDEFWAVHNCSFELRRGDCLGLIGHNGAGKSTLLKILNNLIKPDSGYIRMRGRICALIELSAGFSPILSGRENIFNQGAIIGLTNAEILAKMDDIIEFSELGDFIDMPLQNYSSGMKVRLGFAVAIQQQPDVLLLDEVLAVGDVAFRNKCLDAMADMLKNSAVIFVSHSMSQIHRICNSVGLMDHGKMKYIGNNVSEGVRQYFDLSPSQGLKVSGENEEIEISPVRLKSDGQELHQDGEQVVKLESGHTMDIEFDAWVKSGSLKCQVSIVTWNSEVYPIDTLVTEDANQHQLQLTENKRTFRIRIEKLLLIGGRYTLSMYFTELPYHRILLQVDNATNFVIAGEALGQACHQTPTTLIEI